MSTDNHKAIRAAATAALKQGPARDDPLFVTVRRAKAEAPVLVHDLSGEPAFWLVPFVVQDKVCGLVEVDLAGKITRVGILGSTPDDRHSWFDASFFEHPPETIMADIRTRYGESTLSIPLLCFDGSPSKWAWKVEVMGERSAPGATTVFITPSGWYERRPGDARQAREG